MNFVLKPWQLLLLILAGWINRHQQDAIEYLLTENQVLREKLGKGRIPLNDDQRRRLAVKGKVLSRKTLNELARIVRPDTLLRWHRELIARKWDHSITRQSIGRPRVRQQIVDLALRFAQENPTWGYDRIQGALANVGYHISDTTVGNLLKAHGIEPAPDRERSTTWRTFLKAQWDSISAADFTTVEVWTRSGLITFYLLVVMHLKTRRIEIAGATPHPNSQCMQQVGRNLTDCVDGFFRLSTHVILDRDTKHLPLRQILKSSDIELARISHRWSAAPPQSSALAGRVGGVLPAIGMPVGGGFPVSPFRLRSGFTVPPWTRGLTSCHPRPSQNRTSGFPTYGSSVAIQGRLLASGLRSWTRRTKGQPTQARA